MKSILRALCVSTALTVSATAALAEVKIGVIFDLAGGSNICGILQGKVLDLAVAGITASGGMNGDEIVVVGEDARFELSDSTQFARNSVLRDGIVAMCSGPASRSREASRPILRKAIIVFFDI